MKSVRSIPLSYLKVCEQSHAKVCEHVVNLRSGSICVSLGKLHSGGQGETAVRENV